MNHLAFVLPAYLAGVLWPSVVGIAAWMRTTRASRRLAILDPRMHRKHEATP